MIVALAPVVMLVAFVVHPFIAVLPNAQAVADSVAGNTTRWAIAHLLTAVGSGLIALAFLAVQRHLRDVGAERRSAWGLPLIIFGSVLYAFLPGLEFAPLAAAQTSGDVVAVQDALERWFVPVFLPSAITFGIGAFAFAEDIASSSVLSPRRRQTVVAALALMAIARAVPLGVAQFYVQGLAGLVALWPLALGMRAGARAAAPMYAKHTPAATRGAGGAA